MNRREFINWVGVGGIMTSLPIAIAACAPKTLESSSPSVSPRTDGFQAIGTTVDIDKTGQILDEKFSAGKLLVIRDPINPAQVIAVNPTCPHAGCTVAWQKNQDSFVCPCHNSKFASNGTVQEGPAKQSLSTYTAKIENNVILVKAS
ncbi:MAG TPA: Rieske (2Fe-2S) protein [Coleofasciculaceae cyanobacterium]|jgi:cytochrome b6-f complex iron-sulfur subunit